MDEQDKKMVEMLQQMQRDIEASIKGSVTKEDAALAREVEMLNWEESARGIVQAGPCASQAGCTARCKPNVILCNADFICEADHICGYRCRVVNSPCGNRICYSQPH